MADKGIIFSASMVRALLDGRKTQTRRLISTTKKPMAESIVLRMEGPQFGGTGYLFDPPYAVGDRLYVREAHRLTDCTCTEACRGPGHVWYEADDSGYRAVAGNRLRPSIHMPRWASRLWLAVTDVRVQRLQDCSEAHAIAEGIYEVRSRAGDGMRHFGTKDADSVWPTATRAYRTLWDTLHTADGTNWEANPWVVAVSFAVHQGNIDAGGL